MGAPSGTVTFLFTDIEGSTRLWQQDKAAMGTALARHDQVIREAVAAHGGEVFSTSGDGLAVAFPTASSAVAAALAAQQSLGAELWPTASPLRVRMGLHTGEGERRDGDYFGPAVNRAARLMGVGHGGQVLMPFQGKPSQPEHLHERTSDQRVFPHAVDLAEQQETRLIQRAAGSCQRRRLDHQVQIRDREVSSCPL